MKITVWLARMHRATWIVAAEASVLGLILLAGPGKWVRLVVGVPVLVHLGYTAMTSLPFGELPKKPSDARVRRNQDLRSHVIGFLNEVRRLEEYVQQARTAGLPTDQVEQSKQVGHRRIMAAAARVSQVTGRGDEPGRGSGSGRASGPTSEGAGPLFEQLRDRLRGVWKPAH